jgi:hypothetical protein
MDEEMKKGASFQREKETRRPSIEDAKKKDVLWFAN